VKSSCNKWLEVFFFVQILAAPAAFANAIRFDFGSTGSPSITALFEDAGPNQVQLTVTALALSGNNSVNSLYFNFNPAFDSRNLTFTQIGSIGAAQGVASSANDSYKAIGGGGKFDINLTFGPTPTFVTGDVATFTITGSDNFSLDDFLFHETAAAGRSPAYAAGSLQELSGVVVVQGTPTITESVPDVASTCGLLALGLLGIGLFSRRLRLIKRHQGN
jgi:protein with PEP-CTERM/exosortase system signal